MYIYIDFLFCFNIFDYSTTSRATHASVLQTRSGRIPELDEIFLASGGQRLSLDGEHLSFVRKYPRMDRIFLELRLYTLLFSSPKQSSQLEDASSILEMDLVKIERWRDEPIRLWTV